MIAIMGLIPVDPVESARRNDLEGADDIGPAAEFPAAPRVAKQNAGWAPTALAAAGVITSQDAYLQSRRIDNSL